MKIVPVTELRQRAAEILEDVHGSEEPYVIVQRSQKTAYLVDAERYEQQMAELHSARRQLFLREVREAEAEYTAEQSHEYDDMESLLADLRG